MHLLQLQIILVLLVGFHADSLGKDEVAGIPVADIDNLAFLAK